MEKPSELVGALSDAGGLLFQALNYVVMQEPHKVLITLDHAERMLKDVRERVEREAVAALTTTQKVQMVG